MHFYETCPPILSTHIIIPNVIHILCEIESKILCPKSYIGKYSMIFPFGGTSQINKQNSEEIEATFAKLY